MDQAIAEIASWHSIVHACRFAACSICMGACRDSHGVAFLEDSIEDAPDDAVPAETADVMAISSDEEMAESQGVLQLANQLAAVTLAAGVSEGSSGPAVDLQPRVLFAPTENED